MKNNIFSTKDTKMDELELISIYDTMWRLRVNPIIMPDTLPQLMTIYPHETWHIIGFFVDNDYNIHLSPKLYGDMLYINYLVDNGYKKQIEEMKGYGMDYLRESVRGEADDPLHAMEYAISIPLLLNGITDVDELTDIIKLIFEYLVNFTSYKHFIGINGENMTYDADGIMADIIKNRENSSLINTKLRVSLFTTNELFLPDLYSTGMADALVRARVVSPPFLTSPKENYRKEYKSIDFDSIVHYYNNRLLFDNLILSKGWFPLNLNLLWENLVIDVNIRNIDVNTNTLQNTLSVLPFVDKESFDILSDKIRSYSNNYFNIVKYIELVKVFRKMKEDESDERDECTDKESGEVSYLKRIFG